MSDSTSNQQPGGSPLSGIRALLKRFKIGSDVAVAFGVIGILTLLMVPMPTWLLDIGLAISITFSVMVLMTVLFIEKPSQFNSFPTVLLIATMLRLSLNLASTRLILSEGHTGPQAAGDVIFAFSNFIMSGNFVIGIIVFGILVIVNFMVITKGSGRIAEVAARFTLDALPGKQMAIDADLSSGLIDEEGAKERRKELEKESQFFGAMDGASKFVRGDAIAGLIIVAINVIGGMLIGMLQRDMSFGDAASVYTTLTVGDGLVSQIPALLVSTAAGFMVAQAGMGEQADKALVRQFTAYPTALGMVAILAFGMGLLPGMPFIPFAILAAVIGGYAFYLFRKQEKEVEDSIAMEAMEAADAPPEEEPISTALIIDDIRLELGYGLLPMISESGGYRLTDQIKALRRQLAGELGFVLPSVRILDNMQLPAETYVIRIKEVEAGRGDIQADRLLVMDPRGLPIDLPGDQTIEPTFGLPALWTPNDNREEAMFRGYTVVDPATVLTTHLTELVKDNLEELMSYAATQKLLDEMGKEEQKLIADIIPNQITVNGVQRVLQNLLAERISIRDLPTILEGIAEATGYTSNVMMITEHVRARLARQISAANANDQGFIPLVALSPDWEQAFSESLVGQGDEKQLSMSPTKLQEFITAVRMAFEDLAKEGELPVLLTSPLVRPYVRSVIERFRPSTIIISQNEIHPKAKIRTLGQV